MADALDAFSSDVVGLRILILLTDWQSRVKILPIIIDMVLHHGPTHQILTSIEKTILKIRFRGMFITAKSVDDKFSKFQGLLL